MVRDIVSIHPEQANGPRADTAPELSARDADALRSKEALEDSKLDAGWCTLSEAG